MHAPRELAFLNNYGLSHAQKRDGTCCWLLHTHQTLFHIHITIKIAPNCYKGLDQ